MAAFVPEVKQKAQLEYTAARCLRRLQASFSICKTPLMLLIRGGRIKISRYETAKKNGIPAYSRRPVEAGMSTWRGAQVKMKQPNVSRPSDGAGVEGRAAERRQARQRVLKRACITFNARGAVIDCTVRNLSDHGACLNVESPVGIPDSFALMLGQQSVRNFRVAWRKATQIGVEFI